MINVLEKLGGWPVLIGDSWDEKTFDWSDMNEFKKMGYSGNYFISTDIEIYDKDNSKHIITVSTIEDKKSNWKYNQITFFIIFTVASSNSGENTKIS